MKPHQEVNKKKTRQTATTGIRIKFRQTEHGITTKILTMENSKLFSDMPSAPKVPKLPKHFPDLQGNLRGRTPGAGWYQNDVQPILQSQEIKNFLGYGIGVALVIGCVMLGIEIYNYQDEIQEFASELIEKTMGFLEAGKEKISSLLGEMKEKIMNVQYPFGPILSNQGADEVDGDGRSMFDKIKDVLQYPFGPILSNQGADEVDGQ